MKKSQPFILSRSGKPAGGSLENTRRDLLRRNAAAVAPVADDGHAARRKLRADLVRAPRVERHAHQRERLLPLLFAREFLKMQTRLAHARALAPHHERLVRARIVVQKVFVHAAVARIAGNDREVRFDARSRK